MEVNPYTGQSVEEDAPTNSAGSGAVAGIGVGPDGEPGFDPKKKKKKTLIDARSKSYKEHRMKLERARQRREERKSKLAQKVAENIDNFAREKYIEVELDEIFGKKETDVTKKYKGKEQKTIDSMIKRLGLDRVQMMHDKDPKAFDKAIKIKSKSGHRFSEEVELEEVNISDYVVNTLRDIKRSKSARNLKLKGGSVKVDMNTANMMLQVLDKINPMNKKKIMDILDKGTKNDFMKVHGAVMKAIR